MESVGWWSQKPNSRATLQGLDQRIKVEKVEAKMACQRGSVAASTVQKKVLVGLVYVASGQNSSTGRFACSLVAFF